MGQLLLSSQACKKCGARRGTAVYTENEYCFACGNNKSYVRNFKPKEIKEVKFDGKLPEYSEFPKEAKEWLLKNRLLISPHNHIENFNIGYSKDLDRIIFPICNERGKLMAYQGRSLNPEDKAKWMTYSRMYTWGRKFPFICLGKSDRVVVTEDIVSAIRISPYASVISILGCKVNKELRNLLLGLSKKFAIWLDGDRAGKKGADILYTKLGLAADVRQISTRQDPKEFSDEDIQKILRGVL